VLSNHDVIRHPSRYGLPPSDDRAADHLGSRQGLAWLMSGGSEPVLDAELGLRRGLAATLLLLALPGSAYLYQGEELGLHEVATLPVDVLQDPLWERTNHTVKGRDGCRVPLPWTSGGPSYGFGPAGAHLPQPPWFAEMSVEVQDVDPSSPLNLYRAALHLRRRLQGAEELAWLPSAPDVIHLERPGGWQSVTNMGTGPVPLPPGEVLLASGPLAGDHLPPDTTVWLRSAASGAPMSPSPAAVAAPRSPGSRAPAR
jgi:alpha-glucosidase